jgi:hypothetical protein
MGGAIANASGKAKFAGQVWAKTPFGKVGRTPAGEWSARATAAQVGKAAAMAGRYGFEKAYVFSKTRDVSKFTHEIPSGTQLFGKTFETYKLPKDAFNRRVSGLKSFYRNKVKVDPALQRWTRGIGLATGVGVAFIMQDKNTKIDLAPYIGATLTAGIAGFGLYKTKAFKNFVSGFKSSYR